MMNIEQDLECLARQEQALVFTSFDANTAWTIGTRIRTLAAMRGQAVAINILLNGHTLFAMAMAGTTPDNVDTIRRKSNVVQRFHKSSYLIALQMRKQDTTLHIKTGLPVTDYAAFGGSFPINLNATGCVGSITVSGLPQRADHALIVEVLAEFLQQSVADLALPA